MSRALNQLRELDITGLKKQLEETRKELFFLRYKSVTDSVERNSDFGNLRRRIARIHTIIRERETGIRGEK
jgi:large subunit ribosomal protein L29